MTVSVSSLPLRQNTLIGATYKRFSWLACLGHRPAWRKVGQELKPWRNAFADILTTPCLPRFHIQPRTTCPGNGASHSGLCPPTSTTNLDNLYRHIHKPISGQSSIKTPFSDDIRMGRVEAKASRDSDLSPWKHPQVGTRNLLSPHKPLSGLFLTVPSKENHCPGLNLNYNLT